MCVKVELHHYLAPRATGNRLEPAAPAGRALDKLRYYIELGVELQLLPKPPSPLAKTKPALTSPVPQVKLRRTMSLELFNLCHIHNLPTKPGTTFKLC